MERKLPAVILKMLLMVLQYVQNVLPFLKHFQREKDIIALAVAGEVEEPISPCGACRQVISELAPQAVVYLSNRDGSKLKG